MLNVMAPKIGDMATIIKVDEILNLSKQLQRHVGDVQPVRDFVANTHVCNINQVSEPVSKYNH
jgi:hypothetical protein